MTDSYIGSEFDTVLNAGLDSDGFIICPVLPLKGVVVFPNVITPVTVSAERGLEAAQAAIEAHSTIIALTLKNPDVDHPTLDDFYRTGTEAALSNMLPYPDRRRSVLVQGRRRVEVVEIVSEPDAPYLVVKARVLSEQRIETDDTYILTQTVVNLFQAAAELNDIIAEDVIEHVQTIDDPGWLADFVTSTLTATVEARQLVLSELDINARLQEVARLVAREVSMLELRDEINDQIQEEINRTQREMFLREQMRVIQTELGEDDIFQQETNDLKDAIDKAQLPPEVHERAMKELSRMAMMPPMAPEIGIIRTYIEWLIEIPWTKATEDNLDMANAQKVLDENHYGLPKIKDRILEYIAVRKLAPEKMKTPILCFVGPPGVGKTSLGKSIALALGREFVRVSLGGIHDEAEIRGHRRTYIGALPGRIIQTMRRAGTVNPVFMLDEIDKIGADFRGDPAAALLEALDPEQNREYSDHYLDAPYDLSKVLFITTANDLYPLPEALLDRLEVIEFPGYPEDEKLEIAWQFLIPDQLESHGLKAEEVHFNTSALQTIIREYTYEAGVRNLNREIANVCRKIARQVAEGKTPPRRITSNHINRFLGPPTYLEPRANQEDSIGQATGLAWTWAGGDILTIEVSVLPGKGTLMMTGQLGEVMQESAQAAMSYMRSRAKDLDVPHDDFDSYDVHVHIPEGAIPKDGPSAGITLAAAIISAFTERPLRADFAMTGEITLRGRVLPVGGIKEKVLAAHRAHVMNIILPTRNKKDLEDVPQKTMRQLKIHFVDDMQQVMDLVLGEAPEERERDKDRKENEKNDEQDQDQDQESEK